MATKEYSSIIIGGVDCTHLANGLKATEIEKYLSQTTAEGNTVIELINKKHQFEISFPSLKHMDVEKILKVVENGNVSITIRRPARKGNIMNFNDTFNCFCDTREVEYMFIHGEYNARFKPFTLTFVEL